MRQDKFANDKENEDVTADSPRLYSTGEEASIEAEILARAWNS